MEFKETFMRHIFVLFLILTNLYYVHANVDPWNTYQWNAKRTDSHGPWFEWWYYKITLPKSEAIEPDESFFFVYGVVNPWDENKKMKGTRSYVSMGDFGKKIQLEGKFAVQDFYAKADETYVNIRNNVATDKFLKGELTNKNGTHYKWDITIEKKWSFNAEAWMMGSLLTDIEWYPAQADALCSGIIFRNNEKIEFKDAPCYQDRNWGTQFPEWWAWIVSNKFENNAGSVLAAGGGKPHVRGITTPFSAMSIGLKHQGSEYSFSPILFHYIDSQINYGTWKITGKSLPYAIKLKAYAPKESFMDLQFMTPQGEIFHDYETLNGNLEVKMYKRAGLNYVPIFNLFSKYAGIEYGSKNEYSEFQKK